MRRLVSGLLVLVLAAAAWGWWTSDRRRLSARLAAIQEWFEKSGPEDQLTSFGKTRRIVEAFAPGFVVLARPYEATVTDRQQLAAIVQRYRDGAAAIRVDAAEREVRIDRGLGSAETSARFAVAEGALGRGERFRARIVWVRDQGEWWIREFEITEVLAP